MNAHWRDWMSDSTWAMMKQRTSLRRAGQLRRAEGQCMQRAIHAALKRDRAPHTAQVGKLIDTDLAEGNIHEAFRHLNQLPQKESSGKLCGSRSRQLSASAPRLSPVFTPWNGRCWNALSFIGGPTRLAPPSSSKMLRCLPKKSEMILPLMGKYKSRSPSSPMAAAQ